jgi:hypothetical protein
MSSAQQQRNCQPCLLLITAVCLVTTQYYIYRLYLELQKCSKGYPSAYRTASYLVNTFQVTEQSTLWFMIKMPWIFSISFSAVCGLRPKFVFHHLSSVNTPVSYCSLCPTLILYNEIFFINHPWLAKCIYIRKFIATFNVGWILSTWLG